MNNFLYKRKVRIVIDSTIRNSNLYDLYIDYYILGLKADSDHLGKLTEHEAALVAGIVDKIGIDLDIK